MTAGPEEEIALLMRRWEQVKAGDGAVVLIGGEPGNREIAPRAAAHRVAEARRIVANQSSRSNGGLTTFDCYEFVIKPILVRVCGESVFGLNYNNSLSLWNFDEYFLKCRVRTSQAASFMAATQGRLTGRPGVCLVLAGFFAKFYVFLAAIKAGLYALAVIGVLAS